MSGTCFVIVPFAFLKNRISSGSWSKNLFLVGGFDTSEGLPYYHKVIANTSCSKEPICAVLNNIPTPSPNAAAQNFLERTMKFYAIIIKDKSKLLTLKKVDFIF